MENCSGYDLSLAAIHKTDEDQIVNSHARQYNSFWQGLRNKQLVLPDVPS